MVARRVNLGMISLRHGFSFKGRLILSHYRGWWWIHGRNKRSWLNVLRPNSGCIYFSLQSPPLYTVSGLHFSDCPQALASPQSF